MLWINLFVYADSRILELFSPFTKFKNKQKQGKNPPKQKNHQNHKPTNKQKFPNKQKKTQSKKKAPQSNQKPQPNFFFLSTVILLLCLSREGARFTPAENIPLWNNQATNITSLKLAPNPSSPNVYIPVINNESYLPWLLLSPPAVFWKLVFSMLS